MDVGSFLAFDAQLRGEYQFKYRKNGPLLWKANHLHGKMQRVSFHNVS
jgi:hypothetical protein